MGTYTDDKPFSVDLVATVLRQAPSTDELYQLGWSSGEFIGTVEYERVSHHCLFDTKGRGAPASPSPLARSPCNRFLSLITSLPGSPFVPRMDIDFAWQ